MDNQVCPKCKSPILPGENFCPKCGFEVRTILQPISIGRQIYQYIFSFILPPFGLPWAFKDIFSPNPQHKRVGWIIIILTVVSLAVSAWIVAGFFQGLQNQLNSYSTLGL